jgi:hypothetical protein
MTTANTPLPQFDPDWASPTNWAVLYRELEWQVVPAHMPAPPPFQWKRPQLVEWKTFQEELIPQTLFDRMYGAGGEFIKRNNMGLLTGRCSGNIGVLDLDEHKHETAKQWWRDLLEAENSRIEPETVQQKTGGGGRQLLFRFPAGWNIPTRRTQIGVDIRGQGGFAMLPPSGHDSGGIYGWVQGFEPWTIPVADAPQWLMDAIEALVEAHGGDESWLASEHTASPDSDYTPFGSRQDGRETEMYRVVWWQVLELYRVAPIKPIGPGETAACEAAYLVYEDRVVSRVPGDKAEGLEREGRGRSAFARKWRATMRHWGSDRMVAEAAKPAPEAKPSGHPASEPPPAPDPANPPTPIPLISPFPIDKTKLPTRNWSIVGLLLKGSLSVLVGPPGAGKSLLALQGAIAVALGIPWAGWAPRKADKVLVINAEDDIIEMERRISCACEVMGVDTAELAGRLFLAEVPKSIVVAKWDPKLKTVVRQPLIEELVVTIETIGIGLVVADPFAETFEGDENSNSEVKWAAMLWREVARRTACALWLIHHTRKYAGNMAGEADASRGASALIGTARVVSTLFTMTKDEAGVMNVGDDKRVDYVRFDDAKANYSRPDEARWFEKKTINVGNGDRLGPSDEVGVLVPWKPPGALFGVSNDDINGCLDLINRGIPFDDETGTPSGEFYSASAAGAKNSRWVGHPIMQKLGLSQGATKKLVKKWIENGVLEPFEYTVRGRKQKGLRAVQQNRPGTEEVFG